MLNNQGVNYYAGAGVYAPTLPHPSSPSWTQVGNSMSYYAGAGVYAPTLGHPSSIPTLSSPSPAINNPINISPSPTPVVNGPTQILPTLLPVTGINNPSPLPIGTINNPQPTTPINTNPPSLDQRLEEQKGINMANRQMANNINKVSDALGEGLCQSGYTLAGTFIQFVGNAVTEDTVESVRSMGEIIQDHHNDD